MIIPQDVYAQCIKPKSLNHKNSMLPILNRNSTKVYLACPDRQQFTGVNANIYLHKIIRKIQYANISYNLSTRDDYKNNNNNNKIGMLPQNFPNPQPPALLKPIHNQNSNEHIWHSADKLRNKKNLPISHGQPSNQTQMSIKRRRIFEMKIKSMEKSERSQRFDRIDANKLSARYQRSNSEQDGEKGHLHKRSKNHGYVSHLFSVLRRNQSQRSSQQKESKLNKSHLKQQLEHLSANSNQMAPGKIRNNLKSFTKRISLNSLSKQKQTNQSDKSSQSLVTSKTLKDYSNFIQTQTIYTTRVCFNWLRNMDKVQAFSNVNIKEYKLVESIVLCVVDALNGQQPSSQYLIQEYCGLYFQNQERRKFEVLVNYHVFKGFAIKIKGVYAYTRFSLYFVSKLAQHGLLFKEDARDLALDGCKLVDRLLKSLFEAVSQSLARSNNSVLQTFKSLKTVKQVQKIVSEYQSLLVKIQCILNKQSGSSLSNKDKFQLEMTEILTHLKPFFNQCSFYHLEEYICRAQIILSWKYLKIPPNPYLPEKRQDSSSDKYTLVMGLNKVLILYNQVNRLLKYRPFMDTFLARIKDCYEIIVFSEFQKVLTDRIVKQIEKDQTFFSARLYHTHLSFKNGNLIKDLLRLGRSLENVVFLDIKEFCQYFPQNSVVISDYKPPNMAASTLVREKTLLNTMNKLLMIEKEYPNDVRKTIRKTADLYQIPEVSSIEECSISIQHCEGGRSMGKTLDKD